MSEVTIQNLSKRFGDKSALGRIDLHIESGEFVTLLGPSGCGKTTTLRCLAGLERPTSGVVSIGGSVVVDAERRMFVAPERRRVGMVFQSYALWPHMTVGENVAYPLKIARVPRTERVERVRAMLEVIGLDELLDRPVTSLSGGQQQRIALARALIARPRLIFFDEPLSNLDTKLRYLMSQEIRRLHDEFETTSIYVTHDQEEALTLSDRIVVMNQGRIEQVGTPKELYERPATAFVADFMGFQNVWAATVVGVGAGQIDARVDGTAVTLSALTTETYAIGQAVQLAFRASRLRLLPPDAPSATGVIVGTVARTTYLGGALNVLVDVGRRVLRARIEGSDMERLEDAPPQPGDRTTVAVSPAHVAVIPLG